MTALDACRPALLFLPAAAASLRGRALVIAAPPGPVRTAVAARLREAGFDSLGSGMAAIDADRYMVWPCSTPAGAGRSSTMPSYPLPLVALFFMNPEPWASWICRRIATDHAEACLTGGIRRAAGGDRALARTLAGTVPCFEINGADPDAAAAAVRSVVVEGQYRA